MKGEWRLEVGHLSDAGKRREANEDSLGTPEGVPPEVLARKGRLYVVADGIGGHAGGKMASSLAVQQVLREYYGDPSTNLEESLRQAILAANRAVHDQAQDAKYEGMGTTLVAALVQGNRLVVANVGDSRAYLVREGKISQITRDHSWVAEQRDAGLLTEEEAWQHPYRHIILRSLGGKPEVEVDFFRRALRPGNTVLLCTDGLSDMVEAGEMLRTVDKQRPQAVVESLVELANRRGSPDNVTAVALRVVGSPASAGGLAGLPRLLRSAWWIPLLGGTAIVALTLILVWALRAPGLGRPREATPESPAVVATAATGVEPAMTQETLAAQPAAPSPLVRVPVLMVEVVEETREAPTPSPAETVPATIRSEPSPTPAGSPPPTPMQPSQVSIRPSPEPTIHVIQQGEYLASIAAHYGVARDVLIAFNDLRDPHVVHAGQEIRVPLFEYVVRPGEMLGDIAAYYDVSEESIRCINALLSTDSIGEGQSLRIPLWGQNGPCTYIVRPGDNLTVIAKRYGITVEALAEANGLSLGDLVYAGQELVVPEQ